MDLNGSFTPNCTEADYNSVFVDFLLLCVALSTLAFVGIVCNIFNIIVFAHPKMRRLPTNVFFISISVADIGVLLTSVLVFALPNLYYFLDASKYDVIPAIRASAHIVRWSYAFANISQTFVVWLTVSVALFRYVALCMPLYGQRHCSLKNARIIVVTVLIASIAFNMPRFFELKPMDGECRIGDEVLMLTIVLPSDLRMKNLYVKVYINMLYNGLIFIIPFAVLFFVNFQAIAAVRRSHVLRRKQIERTQHRHSTAANNMLSRGQITTTIMLIGIVFVFLSCNLPTFAANIVEMLLGSDESAHRADYVRFVDVSNLLVVLNSSANIIIYISLSKQYRKLLLYVIFRYGPPPKGWHALGYLPAPVTLKNRSKTAAGIMHFGSLHQSKRLSSGESL